jgi:hypothetical protein
LHVERESWLNRHVKEKLTLLNSMKILSLV